MPRTENKFPPVQEGLAVLEVMEAPGDEIKTEKATYRKWKFLLRDKEGGVRQIWQNLFAADELSLLEALGYKPDERGGIDWEYADVKGKTFRAFVYNDKYNGQSYGKCKDFQPDTETIPF